MNKTVSEIINEYLKKNERTKSWLAKKIGIPQTSIYKKFNSDYFTAIEFLRAAEALNIDIDEIMHNLNTVYDKRELIKQ